MSDKWKTVTIGSLITKRSDCNHPELPLLSVVRSKGVIVRDISSKAENHNFIPDDLSGYKLVMPGDLVINKMKAWSGSLGVSNWKGIVSPAYYVYSLGYKVPHYAHYLLRTSKFAEEFARCSDGIRVGQWDLSISAFKRIMVPVPSEIEQKNIVKYLDHYMFAFNKAVNAKLTLINLLEEKKIRIIDELVNNGVSSNKNYYDSGLPWLPPVPGHWKVQPLRAYLEHTKRLVGKDSNKYNLLSLTKGGVILRDLSEMKGKFPASFDTYQRVEPGDFIFCLFDIDETPRTVGKSNLSGMITGAYSSYKHLGTGNADYLELQLLAIDNQKKFKPLYRGLRKIISKDEFLSIRVMEPPLEEQDAIVARIRVETEGIEFAISAIKNEISLMREHKERLIRDVTMGHFDVQKLAQNLSEIELDVVEIPESEVELEDD